MPGPRRSSSRALAGLVLVAATLLVTGCGEDPQQLAGSIKLHSKPSGRPPKTRAEAKAAAAAKAADQRH